MLSSNVWCEKFVDYLTDALAVYDVDDMRQELERWGEQMAEAVQDDPNKPYTAAEHQEALDTMSEFLGARREFVAQWLSEEHCPVQGW